MAVIPGSRTMDFAGRGAALSPDGIKAAVDRLGVEPAALWAVLRVETSGCGFLHDRRPQILFERHVFARETGGRFTLTTPDVSNPTAGGYGLRGTHQYERLARAIALDRRAALRSASWGIGQIMGFHAELLGYGDVERLVAALVESEDEQLRAMAAFVANHGLHHALQRSDFTAFARGYNGVGFERNRYDVRLRDEYAALRAGGLPDLQVRSAQLYLTYAGLDPGPIDGKAGNRTRAAVVAFQRQAGLDATGDLDEATLARLAST